MGPAEHPPGKCTVWLTCTAGQLSLRFYGSRVCCPWIPPGTSERFTRAAPPAGSSLRLRPHRHRRGLRGPLVRSGEKKQRPRVVFPAIALSLPSRSILRPFQSAAVVPWLGQPGGGLCLVTDPVSSFSGRSGMPRPPCVSVCRKPPSWGGRSWCWTSWSRPRAARPGVSGPPAVAGACSLWFSSVSLGPHRSPRG